MHSSSPLSTSAESLCSIRSSCSTRSASEREAERKERRRLIDVSINKIQAPNLPLRRHLLVYNTIKALQRDLECLDEEELYVSLMEPVIDPAMEVDHWLAVSERALLASNGDELTKKESGQNDNMDTTTWQWPTGERREGQGEDANRSQHQELEVSREVSSCTSDGSPSTWSWPSSSALLGASSCRGGPSSPGWSISSSWDGYSPSPSSSLFSSSLRDDTLMSLAVAAATMEGCAQQAGGAADGDQLAWAIEMGLVSWEGGAPPYGDAFSLSPRDAFHLLPMQA